MRSNSGKRGLFISLFAATAAAMLGIGIIEPIMPLYAKDLGASGVMLGFIFSGFAVSRAIFAPILGRLSDTRGRKKMMVGGLILLILFSMLYVLANTPLALVVIRTGQGLASVMITPIAQAYIGDLTPRGKEGRYMNLFFISYFSGTALGPVTGGYLSDRFSIEAPFYVMALMAFISLILVLLLIPKSKTQSDSESAKQGETAMEGLKKILENMSMRGIMIYLVSRGFYRWGFNSFFPIFAVRFADLSKTQIGLALSGYMFAGAVLQYPSGVLADKYPSFRSRFIFVGGILSALCMFIIPVLRSVYVIILFTLFMGVTSAFSRASNVAIRTELGRVFGMGAVSGAATTSMSIGQIIGPLLFGLTVDLLDIQEAFYLGGVVGLAGVFLAFWYLKKQ